MVKRGGQWAVWPEGHNIQSYTRILDRNLVCINESAIIIFSVLRLTYTMFLSLKLILSWLYVEKYFQFVTSLQRKKKFFFKLKLFVTTYFIFCLTPSLKLSLVRILACLLMHLEAVICLYVFIVKTAFKLIIRWKIFSIRLIAST